MFTTNSRVSRMFRAVSFGRPSRSPTETARTIGRLDTPMLYENGAQLLMPARLRVDTNAIGLGTNPEIIRRYESLSGRDDGSTIMDGPFPLGAGLGRLLAASSGLMRQVHRLYGFLTRFRDRLVCRLDAAPPSAGSSP